jgi:hypothetical protein
MADDDPVWGHDIVDVDNTKRVLSCVVTSNDDAAIKSRAVANSAVGYSA